MTYRAASRPPPVAFASPASQPPSDRHSATSSGPAARWIAPSTPPPPRRLEFAALTIASTARVVMSPSKNSMRSAATMRASCRLHADDLARVHDVVGIERLLQLTHDRDRLAV